MGFKRVSEAVIRRLPRYYRHLTMLETQGVERISSERLARQMNLNASQVRQDFNCFGGFGQQGYGYNVSNLTGEIKRIMGIDRKHTIIIVGAGNIGHALTNFPGFAETGFEVKALFDVNEDLIGTEIKGHPVLDVKDMDEYIRENQIDIGVIAARRSASAAANSGLSSASAARRSAAQEIADRMCAAGIRGIWNFVPLDITTSVPIENVHLSESLSTLSYKIEHGLLD